MLTQYGSCSNKNDCKSICLGVDTAGASIIMLITQAMRDIINLSTPMLQAY